MNDYVNDLGEVLAINAASSLKLKDFESIATAIQWAKKDNRLHYLGIFDHKDRPISVFNPKKLALEIHEIPEGETALELGEGLFIAKPIVYFESRQGTLLLAVSLDELHANILDNK